MRRRGIAILVLLIVTASILPASWGSPAKIGDSLVLNPFFRLFDFLEIILLGVWAGGLVAAKFFIDLIRSYYRSDESPDAMKKAVMRLILTVLIVLSATGIVYFVTGI